MKHTALGNTAERLFWLARWYADDTIVSLWLMALAGSDVPELLDLQQALLKVEKLVGIHKARLEGHAITKNGQVYVIEPLVLEKEA